MENKYYTPEIEEFSVGFEYEEYIAGSNTEYISKFWNPEDHFVLYVFENNSQEGWLRGMVKMSQVFEMITKDYKL